MTRETTNRERDERDDREREKKRKKKKKEKGREGEAAPHLYANRIARWGLCKPALDLGLELCLSQRLCAVAGFLCRGSQPRPFPARTPARPHTRLRLDGSGGLGSGEFGTWPSCGVAGSWFGYPSGIWLEVADVIWQRFQITRNS